jgi:hypothetical protein
MPDTNAGINKALDYDKVLATQASITIPKLNDNNWRAWSRIMREFFIGRGLWQLVQDGTRAQPEDEGWVRANAVAMSFLLTSVDMDQIPDLGTTDIAHEAWANLVSKRASKDTQAKLNNLQALFSLTYTEGTVTKFVAQFHQQFLIVNEAGANVSELVGISLLTQKLPDNYGSMIRQHTIVNPDLSIKEAINKIALEEQRLMYVVNNSDAHPVAMSNYASTRRPHSSVNKDNSPTSAPSLPVVRGLPFNRALKPQPQCDHTRHNGGAAGCWHLHPELRPHHANTAEAVWGWGS